MKTKSAIIFTLFFVNTLSANGARLYLEREYQNLWCHNKGGQSEYLLKDNTRVDCLLDEYAIEFDFANKWAESIGQSLYYGIMTNRKSGVVLIMEDEKRDKKYLKRLLKVANLHDITVWTITPSYITNNCK